MEAAQSQQPVHFEPTMPVSVAMFSWLSHWKAHRISGDKSRMSSCTHMPGDDNHIC